MPEQVEVHMVNFATRQKLIWVVGLIGVSLLSYPLSSYVHNVMMTSGSDLYGALAGGHYNAFLPQSAALACTGSCAGFAFSFSLSLIAVLGALRGRTRAVIGGGALTSGVSALVLAAAACVLWIGILFFSGLLTALDRMFLATLLVVTTLLLFGVRLGRQALRVLVPLLVPLLAALVGAIVIWLGLRGVASQSLLTGGFIVAALLVIGLAGGAVSQRGSLPLVPLAIGVHLVFLFGAFLAERAADLPRGLPLVSFGAMLAAGAGLGAIRALFGGVGAGGAGYHPDQSSGLDALPAITRRSETAGQGKRAWIIPLGGGSGFARAQFQAEALAAQGWDTILCAPVDAPVPGGTATVVTLPGQASFRMRTLAGLSAFRYLARKLSGMLPARMWRIVHEFEPAILHGRRSLEWFARQHPELRADVVICADWAYGAAARALAAAYGAKFVYDVAEYPPDQYFNDPKWVADERALVEAVSQADLKRADLVTVSGELLAQRIKNEALLSRDPVVVPAYPNGRAPAAFREVSGSIRILYKDDITGERGVRMLIDALPSLRPEYLLVLRGAADHGFLGELKRQVTRLGVENRVEFEVLDGVDGPPSATHADIGLLLWKGESPKLAYAMPGGLYEHLGEGRGVVLVGAGEAARVVGATGAGRVVGELSPTSLSEALNDLTIADIEGFKRAAIAAAAEMNRAAQGRKLASAL